MSSTDQSVPVVLASASPRRRELLRLIGIEADVIPADIDESVFVGETPAAHVERLARRKAEVIAGAAENAAVIGADTVVVLNDEILGKPAHAAEAARMLKMLSGKTHTVFTGVAVWYGDQLYSAHDQVSVTFRKLTAEDIKAYIATGEPLDKAGAYGIQGYGATIVTRIEGDYFAVMGLSVARLVSLLGMAGLTYRFGAVRAAEVQSVTSSHSRRASG
jgi:septum formation protein